MKIALSVLLNIFVATHLFAVNPVIAAGSIDASSDTVKKAKAKALVFPLPPANPNRLFYVQRDPNTNTIIYDVNVDAKGQLDTETPIHAYWIKYNERGQKEELNFIQRKFAYGLVTKPLDNGKFDVRIVSYKKYPLSLIKSATDNKYHIYATIANKQAILNKVYVKIDGGSFWIPNVIYVEIKGTDAVTGKEVMERFKP